MAAAVYNRTWARIGLIPVAGTMPTTHASSLTPGDGLAKKQREQDNSDNPILGQGHGSFRVHHQNPCDSQWSRLSPWNATARSMTV